MPDFYTLFLVVLLLGLSQCLIWDLVVYRYGELKAARYWFSGSVASVLGGAILALQGNDGLLIQTVLGNSFIVLGFYLNCVGARCFHGARLKLLSVACLFVVSVVLMLATFYPWYARNPVYTLAQLLPLAITAVFLLRHHGGELGAIVSSGAMIVAVSSHAIIACGNILIVTRLTPELDLKAAAAVDLLAFLFAAVVWNFGFLLSAVDRLRGEVERLANEDELTGLANRRMLMNKLAAMCGPSDTKRVFSVMLFDLDRFKAINDKYGHAAGDAALRHAADVVSEKLSANDVFARLGGDEFCLLLPGVLPVDAAARPRTMIKALTATPMIWNDCPLVIKTSIGIACCTTLDKIDPEALLDQADRALYETKKRSRNGYSVYRGSSGAAISGNVIQLNDFVAAEAKSKS